MPQVVGLNSHFVYVIYYILMGKLTFKPIKGIRPNPLLDFLMERHFLYGQEIAITCLLIYYNILLLDLQNELS